MCDLQCGNLIDLSLDDDLVAQTITTQQIKTENKPPPALTLSSSAGVVPDVQFVSPSYRKSYSLDNNPFDIVQALANQRQDDPFDIIEKEACFKAQQSCIPSTEVKEGNLLSLSNDSVDVDDVQLDMELASKKTTKCYNLEAESPPIVMMEKIISVGSSCSETDSNQNSSAESVATSKMKKAVEYRKRLLKLSCTNSALNSPASRRSSVDDPGTPLSALLSRSSQNGESLLASESPLKFVDDDMSEEWPSSLAAEKNFEADLEMLKIPMLNEIPSAESENYLLDIENKLLNSLNCREISSNTLSGLQSIKAKLNAKRMQSNNNDQQEINTLICDLKSLINSGSLVNDATKIRATTILETLSTALSATTVKTNSPIAQQKDNHHQEDNHKEDDQLHQEDDHLHHQEDTHHHQEDTHHDQEDTHHLQEDNDHLAVPHPIKRQGTFDIELQENNCLVQPFVHEMPSEMTSSSATYDGDAPEERHVLDLPEIDPPSSSETSSSGSGVQPDMNDLMEQLSKFIIHNNSGDKSHNTQQNPTFIVVMNTTTQNCSNFAAKENTSKGPSYLELSIRDNFSDLNESRKNIPPRRRSQSLSIHDKVQIVKLPLKPPTPNKCIQKLHNLDVSISPPVVTSPPPNDLSTPEFKTPARMVRRNSYSSGTPQTTALRLSKTGFSCDVNNVTHVRRTSTLDTHHEGQQQQQKAMVRPMTLPANNMATFKPDLKKKHKTYNESIIKSSGPLKATIPVKKVVPMIKTSPSSPDKGSLISGRSLDTSAQLIKLRIPTTPLSHSRPLSKLGVGPGYPNACSTPSGLTSPMKRTSAGVSKPRYSYMSVTPNAKSTTASAASAGLKRRNITDFKVRSPLKSRASSARLSATATSVAPTYSQNSASRLSTSVSSSRLSTSACGKFPSKAPTKLAPNAPAVKPTGRIVQPRLSSIGTARSTCNKENKNP